MLELEAEEWTWNLESWDVFGGPKEAEKEYSTEVEGGGLTVQARYGLNLNNKAMKIIYCPGRVLLPSLITISATQGVLVR